MPHYTSYKCTRCGQPTFRELLTVKQVNFKEMGAGSKIVKSRTVDWLCPKCLEKDEDYKREAFKGTPGLVSEPLERVRKIQEGGA